MPALVNEFRFLAVQAVVKAARLDQLIATHLALELPRRCLVLAMMLRDRDVGTTTHRFGGLAGRERLVGLAPKREADQPVDGC